MPKRIVGSWIPLPLTILLLAGVLALSACDGESTSPHGFGTGDQQTAATDPGDASTGSQTSGQSDDGGSAGDDGAVPAGHYAGDFECDGEASYDSFDNVYVREGFDCLLEGKHVDGNVIVENGGALQLVRTEVKGNVQSYGARYLLIGANHVTGSMQIEGTLGAPPGMPNIICDTRVEGDIQLKNNHAPFAINDWCGAGNEVYGNLQVEENGLANGFEGFEYVFVIEKNHVHGDLQFFKNDGAYLPHRIYMNHIGQNLQCKENYPDPLQGGENQVGGAAEDQCNPLASGF